MAHLYWIFPLKMVIFHSYVKLPEGSPSLAHHDGRGVGLCPDDETGQGGRVEIPREQVLREEVLPA